jgi:hypothetical protein
MESDSAVIRIDDERRKMSSHVIRANPSQCLTRMSCRSISLFAVMLLMSGVAAASPESPQDLKRLSIEQLMEIDITLSARRPEPIAASPTAVSVVTGDDIRRAGVTTLGRRGCAR